MRGPRQGTGGAKSLVYYSSKGRKIISICVIVAVTDRKTKRAAEQSIEDK